MDFIFGTLATDDLKLVHHRVLRRGVQHHHEMQPRDPQPGEAVTLMVRIGHDTDTDHVTVYYTTDGSLPEGKRGNAINGHALALTHTDTVWDTLAWGYLHLWQGTIPAQTEGTCVRYRIGAWSSQHPDETDLYADYPEFKATTERAAAAFFRGEALPADIPPIHAKVDTFTYYVDRLSAPEWAKNAILYQVFVDRFYPGDGREWQQPNDLNGFYGGTLWGVRDKLDYLVDLGIDCIWLSPTFPSPTHHGYDITDYEHVEPRMGGDEAMHALIEAAHAKGIRVVLDLVCNHISNQHPYFVDAFKDQQSPYRDWFIFDDNDPNGYKTFFGVPTMPYINLNDPSARAWMLGIGRYWIEQFDVDGYRLDHANGPGPDFWADLRATCRAIKPDFFTFGEVVESPDILRAYVGRLDGLLDFHVEDALRQTYIYGTMSEAALERFLERHYAYFPSDFVLPTFLDNHDMERFLYVVKGDTAKLRRAAERQFSLPQPPIIYYGTEVGVSQRKGRADDDWGLEYAREPMLWGDQQDTELLNFYKRLISAKRK